MLDAKKWYETRMKKPSFCACWTQISIRLPTYALAKAVSQQPVDAAAYAAYSLVYGYGGYAVNDPSAFAEVHQRQIAYLKMLINASEWA